MSLGAKSGPGRSFLHFLCGFYETKPLSCFLLPAKFKTRLAADLTLIFWAPFPRSFLRLLILRNPPTCITSRFSSQFPSSHFGLCNALCQRKLSFPNKTIDLIYFKSFLFASSKVIQFWEVSNGHLNDLYPFRIPFYIICPTMI